MSSLSELTVSSSHVFIDWTVLGWSEPIFFWRYWTTLLISLIASFLKSRLQNVRASLCMLISVSGSSSPSTLFLVSMTCTNSSLASFHQPWFRYVDARLAILVSVSGCSIPRHSTFCGTTRSHIMTASWYEPRSDEYLANEDWESRYSLV